MDQAISREGVEETTELALHEKDKLVKSLRRLDMIGFTVCAFVGLDTLGTVASNGAQGFTWLIVLAVAFVLPYALLMAEVGSAFTQEGGPYEWSRWPSGASRARSPPSSTGSPTRCGSAARWRSSRPRRGTTTSSGSTPAAAGDYLFKFLFIWLSIGVAIVSLKRGKWIPNAGRSCASSSWASSRSRRSSTPRKTGWNGFPAGDLKPTGAIFLALVPLLLFNYVGFELQNGAAEEMNDPQKDVPAVGPAQRRSACCSTRSRSSRSCSSCPKRRSRASAASSTR